MKKTLAFLLTLAMLVAGFGSFGALAAELTDAVEISTAKDLVEKITANPAGNYVLTNDINFADYDGDGNLDDGLTDGVKVYTDSYIIAKLGGTLDGAGHKIYGYALKPAATSGDMGFIQYLANDGNAVIKNLDFGSEDTLIEYDVSTTAYTTFGALSAAHNNKTNTLTVENVRMYVDIDAYSTNRILGGGFFGATQKAHLVNCELYGNIDTGAKGAWINMGGFAGTAKNGVTTIEDCRNYADITIDETSDAARAAGIIAYTNINVVVDGCVNYGTIKSVEVAGVTGKPIYVGGVVGMFEANGNEMINCANFGDVSSSLYAGGLIASITKNVTNLNNNLNFGKVTSDDAAKANALYNHTSGTIATSKGNYDKSAAFAPYTASDKVAYKGFQGTEAAEGLFNVRFIGVVNALEYTSVGYEIMAYTLENGEVKEWTWTHETQNVYEKVKGTKADGTPFEKTAAELGGSYIFALATMKVPAAEENGNVTFVIKPFAKTATETLYGETAVCIFDTGVCLSNDILK